MEPGFLQTLSRPQHELFSLWGTGLIGPYTRPVQGYRALYETSIGPYMRPVWGPIQYPQEALHHKNKIPLV